MSQKQLREIEPDTDLDNEDQMSVIPKTLLEQNDEMFDEEALSEDDIGESDDSDHDVCIRPGLDQLALDKLDAAEDDMRRAEEAIAQMHRAEVRRGNYLAKKVTQTRLVLDSLEVVEDDLQNDLFSMASLE